MSHQVTVFVYRDIILLYLQTAQLLCYLQASVKETFSFTDLCVCFFSLRTISVAVIKKMKKKRICVEFFVCVVFYRI